MESKENMSKFVNNEFKTPSKTDGNMWLTCQWCPERFRESNDLVVHFKKESQK